MREHKFKVGQKVKLFPRLFSLSPQGGSRVASIQSYQIARLLPADEADPRYRVKGAVKSQDRIVTESEIE